MLPHINSDIFYFIFAINLYFIKKGKNLEGEIISSCSYFLENQINVLRRKSIK